MLESDDLMRYGWAATRMLLYSSSMRSTVELKICLDGLVELDWGGMEFWWLYVFAIRSAVLGCGRVAFCECLVNIFSEVLFQEKVWEFGEEIMFIEFRFLK